MSWITSDDVEGFVAGERQSVTREEHVQWIDDIVAQSAGDVFAHSTAAALAYDAWERRQRLNELFECVKAGGRMHYLKGLFATSTTVQDPMTNRRIATDMKREFPVLYALTKYNPLLNKIFLES